MPFQRPNIETSEQRQEGRWFQSQTLTVAWVAVDVSVLALAVGIIALSVALAHR